MDSKFRPRDGGEGCLPGFGGWLLRLMGRDETTTLWPSLIGTTGLACSTSRSGGDKHRELLLMDKVLRL
jgi:hypothetical protein